MVMNARALDADLGGKITKAEAAISSTALWASATSIGRSAVSSTATFLVLSIDSH